MYPDAPSTILGSWFLLVLGLGTVLGSWFRYRSSVRFLGTVPGFLGTVPGYSSWVRFLGTVLVLICINLTIIPEFLSGNKNIYDLHYLLGSLFAKRFEFFQVIFSIFN